MSSFASPAPPAATSSGAAPPTTTAFKPANLSALASAKHAVRTGATLPPVPVSGYAEVSVLPRAGLWHNFKVVAVTGVLIHYLLWFPELFGGGHAELVMTGEEILDAGVQVMAQPPGQKNSSIYLLSGGEKALTAIALVFSLFLLNPSLRFFYTIPNGFSLIKTGHQNCKFITVHLFF